MYTSRVRSMVAHNKLWEEKKARVLLKLDKANDHNASLVCHILRLPTGWQSTRSRTRACRTCLSVMLAHTPRLLPTPSPWLLEVCSTIAAVGYGNDKYPNVDALKTAKLASSLNWTAEGIVTPVKDRMYCQNERMAFYFCVNMQRAHAEAVGLSLPPKWSRVTSLATLVSSPTLAYSNWLIV
jgi:hypothetical protein